MKFGRKIFKKKSTGADIRRNIKNKGRHDTYIK